MKAESGLDASKLAGVLEYLHRCVALRCLALRCVPAALLFSSAKEVAEHVPHGLPRVFSRLLTPFLAHRRIGHLFVSCFEDLPRAAYIYY